MNWFILSCTVFLVSTSLGYSARVKMFSHNVRWDHEKASPPSDPYEPTHRQDSQSTIASTTTIIEVFQESDRQKIPPLSNMFMTIVQEKQNVSKILPMVLIDSIKLVNDNVYAARLDVRIDGQGPIKEIQTCAFCWNDQKVRCYRHPRISITHLEGFTSIYERAPLTINLYPEDIFQIFVMCFKEESLKRLV
ncbi:uncharacterized protein LOC141855407 [Brevipalpus obovatus]|uniref:uncharacterized protein LOC141855407 n=1 Tax=Brevipalpus obovatus TaxID=246614 RepID=UPI003D9F3B3A